ncbi:hypothetical protein D3C72_691860 [compost metagenome]
MPTPSATWRCWWTYRPTPGWKASPPARHRMPIRSGSRRPPRCIRRSLRTSLTATSVTSSNSATRTTVTNTTSSTCTAISGCSTPMTTTPTTSMPKASGRAPATPMKSPTVVRATVTGSRAMRFITATSTRTLPRACGPCGGCTTCLKKAPNLKCRNKAPTASTVNRMPCAAVNRRRTHGPCPMAKSLPVRQSLQSFHCQAKPCRQCQAKSRSCRKSAKPWWLPTTMTMKKATMTASITTAVSPEPSARWRWSIAAKPTATPMAP